MDPDSKKTNEALKKAVASGKHKNGTILDLSSGRWVKAKTHTVKVYIENEPELHLTIGDSHVVKEPTPAMEALLEHWKETKLVPKVMRVTSGSIYVSLFFSMRMYPSIIFCMNNSTMVFFTAFTLRVFHPLV